TSIGSLQFDPEIEKTARANRTAVRLAKEAARLAELEQHIGEEEEDEEEEASEEEFQEMAENVQNPPPPP
ncbi:hypothetical protein A2U01_0079716, partial [Trifolium medium]|nr:hypothetical protein [Trifolium medium]